MMLTCLLFIFFVPFIASADFDEITYRNYSAMYVAKKQLKRIIEIGKEGGWTYDRAMFVHCNGTDYLRNFTFLAKYDYFKDLRIINADHDKIPTRDYVYRLYTYMLDIELEANNLPLSIQFRYFKKAETSQWELHRVEDLKCGLPKKHPLQEAIEMTQYFYFTKGNWEKDMLPKMFEKDALFKFCDGSVEKYFFRRNDALSKDPVVLHHMVKFERDIERAFDEISFTLLSYVPYIQMDVTVNGRRMQLEYDDDYKIFTKGREYPCNDDNSDNQVEKM